ncbi:MAG: hypothetical protein LAN64_06490 [Acidobacteriia bacterium]|nr:hypothetical protein [Terriglobia bacterium]
MTRPMKHAARYASGTNVVVLEPDVAREFPTDNNEVNESLRAVAMFAERPKNNAAARVERLDA